MLEVVVASDVLTNAYLGQRSVSTLPMRDELHQQRLRYHCAYTCVEWRLSLDLIELFSSKTSAQHPKHETLVAATRIKKLKITAGGQACVPLGLGAGADLGAFGAALSLSADVALSCKGRLIAKICDGDRHSQKT